MAKLDTIDDDVLERIVLYLGHNIGAPIPVYPAWHARALAAVSRRFHEFCAPLIYQNVQWIWGEMFEGGTSFAPESVWKYMRTLNLVLAGDRSPMRVLFSDDPITRWFRMDPPSIISEKLERALPYMPALRTFSIYVPSHRWRGPWHSLLQSLQFSVSIKSIEIHAQWRSSREFLAPLNLKGLALERFIYHAPLAPIFSDSEPNPGRRTPEQCQVETHNLCLLLDQFRGTLKTLELPAEVSGELLCQGQSFPSLENLTVRGFCPSIPHDIRSSYVVPVSTLRNLDLQMIHHGVDSPATFPFYSISHLQSLTLSTVHYMPDHPILRDLPNTVTRLSLNPYPLPFLSPLSPEWLVPVTILSGKDMLRLLNIGTFGNLESLDLSYEWDSHDCDMSILSVLPDCSPYLKALELNRYKGPEKDLDFILNLRTPLRRLHYLQTLRLNLEKIPQLLYERDRRSFWDISLATRRVDCIRELVAALPSLRRISYLAMTRQTRVTWDWVTWNIVRGCDNISDEFELVLVH